MPMSEREPVTIGELYRNQLALEKRLVDRITEVLQEVRALQFIHKDTYDSDQREVSRRLDNLERLDRERDIKDRDRARVWIANFALPLIVGVILTLVSVLVVIR